MPARYDTTRMNDQVLPSLQPCFNLSHKWQSNSVCITDLHWTRFFAYYNFL